MRTDREVVYAVCCNLAPNVLVVHIANVLTLVGVELHVINVGIYHIVSPRVVPSADIDHLEIRILPLASAEHL